MVFVRLLAESLQYATVDGSDIGRSRVNLRVRPASGVEWRTPSEQPLKHLEWSVELYSSENVHPELTAAGAIGRLNYFPARDADDYPHGAVASLWAHVSEETLETLVRNAEHGRLPAAITASVEGLQYGWEPDASSLEWDVEGAPNALVKDVTIGWAHGALRQDEEADMLVPADPSADSSHDRLAALTQHVRELKVLVGWLVFLSAASAVALILR